MLYADIIMKFLDRKLMGYFESSWRSFGSELDSEVGGTASFGFTQDSD